VTEIRELHTVVIRQKITFCDVDVALFLIVYNALRELRSTGMKGNIFQILPVLSLFPISRLLHFPPLKLKLNFYEFFCSAAHSYSQPFTA